MNLKTNVMAAEVANLTDARYFAAWGVEFMTYVVDSSSDKYIGTDAIAEIIEWVEGPQNLGYLPSMAVPSDLAESYTTLQLDGIVVSPFSDKHDFHSITPRVYKEVVLDETLTSKEEELLIVKLPVDKALSSLTTLLQQICQSNEVYIDGIKSITDLDLLLATVAPKGIVVRGGEEEKVGFKSYDELDEIFEYLEIED